MFIYNLKRALAYLIRFRSHTAYSLLGLTVGLACVFIIAAWTIYELRYDRFHSHTNSLLINVKNNR